MHDTYMYKLSRPIALVYIYTFAIKHYGAKDLLQISQRIIRLVYPVTNA